MKTKILDFKNIDISNIDLLPEERAKHITELTIPIILNAIINYTNQQRGLFKTERSLFYSVSPKLEETMKNKTDTLEITDEECGFIRKCFRETKLIPTSLLKPVETYIDGLNQ